MRFPNEASLAMLGLLIATTSIPARATVIPIDASDAGSFTFCDVCGPNPPPSRAYLTVGGNVGTNYYSVGDTRFSTSPIVGQGTVADAQLALNATALPLGETAINVYGFSSTSSQIVGSDVTASSVFLGTWTLPSSISYAQLLYFDVTSFVQGSNGPYAGFLLEGAAGNGTDQFTGVEGQYDYPLPELVVTVVPLPTTFSLLFSGVIGYCVLTKRRPAERPSRPHVLPICCR